MLRRSVLPLALFPFVTIFAVAQTASDTSVTETGLSAAVASVPRPASNEAYLTLPPTEGLADTLQMRGRYLAAIHVYEQLPPTVAILNKLGIACEHMTMWDRARTNFEQALKLNPKFAEAYNNLGTMAHSQGDLPHAEKFYRKSLKLQPGNANTLQNLGTLYYAEHKFKKGDAEYRKALAIDPAVLERSAGHGIPANSSVQSASEVHYHLAATYAHAGSGKLAIDYLRKAVLEGFHDRNRLMRDKEFAELRTTDAFLRIVEDMQPN